MMNATQIAMNKQANLCVLIPQDVAIWDWKDRETSNAQGWQLQHNTKSGMYMVYPYPDRDAYKARLNVRPMYDPEEQEGFQLILENAMIGCPTALKAMRAIVATNPQFKEYQATATALQISALTNG